MQFPIVLEYKKDILQKNPENFIQGEPVTIKTGIYDRVFAPRHPPFFVNTLVITTTSGVPLDLDKDYEIFNIMPKLTGEAGQPVSCLIKMLNPLIKEVLVDYHTVGSMTLVDSSLLSLFISVLNDDRPISFDNIINKPLGFVPNLHGHSLLYEIFAFQDTVDFLGGLLQLIKDKPDAMKIRLDHYLTLIDWYIDLYGGMLNKYLDLHAKTYDSHGLTAKQVALDLVDNYETATAANILQVRNDQHLKPTELKTLIESYSFNTDEFLPARVLPVAQFGTSNFIPPNIDGSFEGFGGVIETGAMSLESDSSIVYLWNRMDGRTRGLYYSILTDSDSPTKAKLVYTGYRFTHPRFTQDNSVIDRLSQGSGAEVMLVGDSLSKNCYVGISNGTLDPIKHVYAKIDMGPLINSIFIKPENGSIGTILKYTSVLLMDGWVYLILSSSVNGPSATNYESSLIYKQFYRVSVADILKGLTVTPVRQNVSFTNADGEQFNNVPFFQWYRITTDQNGQYTKALFTFTPIPATLLSGNYRSQISVSAKDPDRTNIHTVKFLSSYFATTGSANVTFVPEITYDFNTTTGVMTLKSKSNIPPTIDFGKSPTLPLEYKYPEILGMCVYSYGGQGLNITEDGRVVSSGATGFNGFPRLGSVLEFNDTRTRYASVNKLWGNPYNLKQGYSAEEIIVSPLESSINVKGLMYRPGVEYYLASQKNNLGGIKLFRKAVTGKFALIPGVSNIIYPEVLARPLTNNIRPVNAITGLGGVTVTVPSTQLDSYAVEVAESSFCMGAQKRYYNRDRVGKGWTPPVGLDDILLVATHTDRFEQDGSVTIVPTLEILYPAAIVERLKNLVEFLDIKNRSRQCIVTVADPTFSGLSRFGWLPVLVSICYADARNQPTSRNLYTTYAVINPTYGDQNGRKVLTNFNVVDIYHTVDNDAAIDDLAIFNGTSDNTGSLTTVGPMRTYYYVEGTKLSVLFGNGVIAQMPTDSFLGQLRLTYDNRETFRWSTVYQQGTTSFGSSWAVTPDNGITEILPWNETTGGAASITGTATKVMLGSVYPETGWVVFFKAQTQATFNGEPFILPAGSVDLRDVTSSPENKTFYIYAKLVSGEASYEISLEKRLESNFQLWVGTATTNNRQIVTLDRFNVTTINGHRISETRRGNSIPATSGSVTGEGQLPWIKNGEFLP